MSEATNTLIEQAEAEKSFDILASVKMFRYDIDTYGRVLNETRQRVCDEELSFLAEASERASQTSFVLKRDDVGLVYFNKGEWSPYGSMLTKGLNVARKEADQDPRKKFLEEKAANDYLIGQKMQMLRPGQRMSWYSAYPLKQEMLYGKEFLQSLGFIPNRKMAFLYQAVCHENGNVEMLSQTVDNCDEEALIAAVSRAQTNKAENIDDMTAVYDEVLESKTGVPTFAGRTEAEVGENAWKEIKAHTQLIEFYLSELEKIATLTGSIEASELLAKKLIIGFWKTFKNRLEGRVYVPTSNVGAYYAGSNQALMHEIASSYDQFIEEGDVIIGCGGSISMLNGEHNILNADGSTIAESIFGRDKDKFGSLKFKCKNGHTNTRPRGKLISRCKVRSCKNSVAC